eukprot:scaffold52654_cov75-Phaeocystis_antarctica.AAC.2
MSTPPSGRRARAFMDGSAAAGKVAMETAIGAQWHACSAALRHAWSGAWAGTYQVAAAPGHPSCQSTGQRRRCLSPSPQPTPLPCA